MDDTGSVASGSSQTSHDKTTEWPEDPSVSSCDPKYFSQAEQNFEESYEEEESIPVQGEEEVVDDAQLVVWSQPDYQGRQFDPTDFEITDEEPDNDFLKEAVDTSSNLEDSHPDGKIYYNDTHGYTFIDNFEVDAGGNRRLVRKFVPRINQRIRTYKKLVPIKVTFNRLSNDTDIVEEEEDINEEMEVDEITNTVLVKRKDESGKEIVESKEVVQEFIKDPTKKKKFIKLRMVNDIGETVEELIELTDDFKRTNDIMRLAAPFMKKAATSTDKSLTELEETSKSEIPGSPPGVIDWFKTKDVQKEHVKARVITRLKKAREEQKALKEMNRYLGKKLCQFYDLKGPKDPNFNYDERGSLEEERAKYQKRLLEFNDVVNYILGENKKRTERITLAELDVQQTADELKKEKQAFYDLEEAMVADISPAEESKILRSMTFSQLINQQKSMDSSLAKVRLDFIRADVTLKELQARQSDHQAAIDSMEKVDFINYEALRVKTKDLNDKLDLKEKQVLMMKDRLTQRVQALAHVRLKSDHLTAENKKLRNETKDINEELNALRKECLQVQIERRKLEKELSKVTAKEGLDKYPHLLNEAPTIEWKTQRKTDQLSELVNSCSRLKAEMEEKLEKRREEVERYKNLQQEQREKKKMYSFELNE